MLLPLFMMLLFGGTLHSTPVIPLHHKRIYLVNTLFHFLNNSVNQIITAQGPLKDPTNLLWKTALQTPIHLIAAGVKTATGNTAGRNAALEQIKELRPEIKEQDKVGHALFLIAAQSYVGKRIDDFIPVPRKPESTTHEYIHWIANMVTTSMVRSTLTNCVQEKSIASAGLLLAALKLKYETPQLVDRYLVQSAHHEHTPLEKRLTFMQQAVPLFIGAAVSG